MKALKFGGIALLLAAASAYAIDGVVLKYGYKKDSVTKVRIKGTIEVQGMEVTINMINQSKVMDIADDGTVTLEDGMVDDVTVTVFVPRVGWYVAQVDLELDGSSRRFRFEWNGQLQLWRLTGELA